MSFQDLKQTSISFPYQLWTLVWPIFFYYLSLFWFFYLSFVLVRLHINVIIKCVIVCVQLLSLTKLSLIHVVPRINSSLCFLWSSSTVYIYQHFKKNSFSCSGALGLSQFWLLWIQLLWIFVYKSFCEYLD